MISHQTAVARYRRVGQMMDADPDRFKPNSLGAGYLTRQERYCEIRRALERVIERHELVEALDKIASSDEFQTEK